ncbi:MAG TPA: hypothetical protein VNI54_04870 [Thermoanaerobaculia bacterium]|nr:hypothetical protein [Thermoanaerobaculia bacterium]
MIIIKKKALYATPLPDGTFALRPVVNEPAEQLQRVFGPNTVSDANGRLTLNWRALDAEVKQDVINAFPGSSNEVLAEQRATLRAHTVAVDGLRERFDILILLLLAVIVVVAGVIFLRRIRSNKNVERLLREITGSDVTSVEQSLRQISKIVGAAKTYYAGFAETLADPWTIVDWRREAARKSQVVDAGTSVLRNQGDSRSLDLFATETIALLKSVHAVLFGKESQRDWKDVQSTLGELANGKVGGAPLPKDTAPRGLLAVAGEAEQLRSELANERQTTAQWKERFDRIGSLLAACEVNGESAPATIEDAEKRVKEAMNVVTMIRGKGASNDLGGWIADLANARDQSHAELEKAREELEQSKRDVAVAKARTVEENLQVQRWQSQTRTLLERLSLQDAGDARGTASPLDGLQGTAWTAHLDLLALSGAWPEMTRSISPSLASLLYFKQIQQELRDAVGALMRIGTLELEEKGEAIWRIFDHVSRILEFRDCYELHELEPLRPRLELVRADLQSRMESFGVECRRPKLFTTPSAVGSDDDHDDGGLKGDSRIADRIRLELRTRKRFIVDIAQSEVLRDGKSIREGIYVLVNPSRWE